MDMSLRLLMIEDSAEDAELLLFALRKAGYEVMGKRVETAEALRAALTCETWDMITSDHAMPRFSAPEALKLATELCPDVPLIIVSGEIDLNLAVSLLKGGAKDYIQKSELARIGPAVARELKETATQRQQRSTEEALFQQQRLMARIYETSPVGITMVNTAGEITFANPEAERILGLTKDTITQLTYNAPEWQITAIDGGPFPHHELPFIRVLSTGLPVRDVRHAIQWPDGRRVLLSINAAPLADDTGTLTGMVATLHDITEQIRVAASFRESEARFRTLVNSMDDIIFSLDVHGRHSGVYGNWVEKTGLKPEDFLGRTAEDILGPEDGRIHVEAFHRAVQGKTATYDWIVPLSPGGAVHYQTSLSPIYDGESITGVVGVGRNVTQLKQGEEALRLREEQLKASLQNMPNVGVQWYDSQGRVLLWNRASEEIYGWREAEVLGKPLDELILTSEENAQFLDNLQHIAATGESLGPYETIIHRRDGQTGVVLATQFAIPSDTGKPVFGCMDVDITPLKQSQQNFEMLFNSIDDMLFVLDAQGKIVHLNKAVIRRLGYTREELIGQPVLVVHPPELREEAARVVAAMLAGEEVSCPVPVITREGKRIPVDTRVVAGEWNGQPALFGITRDISALQISEEKFARAFHSGAVPMAISTMAEGRYIEINDAFVKTLGYTREEIIGQTNLAIGLFVYPGDRETLRNEIAEKGRVENTLAKVRRKDGEILTGLFTISPVQIGAEACWLTTMHDISAQKQAQQALRESERVYRETSRFLETLLDAIPDMIGVQTAHDHCIVRYNAAGYHFLQRTPEEIIGRCCFELIGHNAPCETCATSLVYVSRRPEHIQKYVPELDTWFDVGAYPVFDEQGEIQYVIEHLRDITLQKNAEDAIRRLNSELEQRVQERTSQLEAANKELEAFSYSVSHDLRAPLRAVDGFTRILLEDHHNQLDNEGRRILKRLREASQRMTQLIDSLLRLSRLSRAGMRPQRVNLSQIAEKIAADLQESQPGRAVTFTIHPSMEAQADPAMIHLLLDNLMRNAWKFTQKHAAAHIEVGSLRQAGRAGQTVYFVRDDGAGFDMTFAEKLFTPFQRLHSPDDFEGTGIGLTIVQRIVHRHGGRIWAEGVPEQGAAFYFTLPGA
jgi:PAS domain S-box-containing protein